MRGTTIPEIVIHDASSQGLPVVTGCPFPAAGVPDDVFDAVLTASGAKMRAQCAALTPATPAGLRWVELSFLATHAGSARVELAPAEGKAAALARATSDGVELSNGQVTVLLSKRRQNAPIAVGIADRKAVHPLGKLTPEWSDAKGRTYTELTSDARKITILRNGPTRAQVEIAGQLAGPDRKPGLAYRLTVELWKGIDALRVDWMLSHLTPDRAAFDVHRATLRGDWAVGRSPVRHFVQCSHSALYVPRAVTNPAPVSLTTDFTCGPVHVTDPAMLLDSEKYAAYLSPPTVRTEEWLCLCGSDASVAATLVDFCVTRPNQLESRGRRLDYHMIPPGHPTSWPQGRRKEQTLLLGFTPGNAATDSARRDVALGAMHALRATSRAQPSPESLKSLQCMDLHVCLPRASGRNIRLSAILAKFCDLDMPGDKWNLGDTPDAWYTRVYPSTPNDLHRLPGAPNMPAQFAAIGHMALWPWSAGEFVEPVWTNNEYDILHTLATEVMRTGSPAHLTMLRWAVRHTVEVDFIAFSDDRYHHRATPFHSRRHNMKGAISSHFWTQGLLQYYALTGDRDALEVALALGDKIIEIDHSEARTWKFDREVGWGLLSLVCLVEVGFDRYRRECDAIGDYLQAYDRAAFSGAVNLSAGHAGRSLERQMIDNGFGYASLVEAMDRWQKVTGRRDTAAWLRTLLLQLKDETWNATRDGAVPTLFSMVPQIMAIGYERTGDRDFLRAGMVTLDAFLASLEPNPAYTGFWGHVKPCAMGYRSLCRFLAHADRLGMLDRFEYPALIEKRRGKR